ncbi:hypothetical protein [Clostridium ganghwense]|uniref:Uncharacterized protein n=1 Tax=Clostridium ganghwense TaxID=312089 RepID=A0ABT4CTP0_9CLOT|nr:hypothetical protein [Clostridium ganghwense]MCY6372412.1 hypothetical protein [Clostridium ganghwense]
MNKIKTLKDTEECRQVYKDILIEEYFNKNIDNLDKIDLNVITEMIIEKKKDGQN